jgi:hypothetical protein
VFRRANLDFRICSHKEGHLKATSATRVLLTTTELGMVTYWVLAGAMSWGLVHIPPDWMYSNHEDPAVVAWNWSFFPLDMLFAGTGLAARYWRRAPARLADVSLTLMFCAGLMALSYWTIRREFDVFWWVTNSWLIGVAVLGFVHGERSAPAHSNAAQDEP